MSLKMVAEMKDGRELEIDTKTMFENQYNTVSGERICDVDIKQIRNDIRERLYVCSVKQGTFEECQEAINNYRKKINQCGDYCGKDKCFWLCINKRIDGQSSRNEHLENGNLVIEEKTVYSLHCHHKEMYGDCQYNIVETPKKFSEEYPDCFFLRYPFGLPDNSDLIDFIYKNAEKFDIVPYWIGNKLVNGTDAKCTKKFGSYQFTIDYYHWGNTNFELSNARNRFRFVYDIEKDKFITKDSIGYEIHNGFDIPEWDKFKKYFNGIISDFKKEI
jgi:hypothetical protein